MMKNCLALCAAAMLLTSGASAEDEIANVRAEVSDLKAKIAAAEAAAAAASGGEAEALTSLKKKGAIKIGGEFLIDCLHLRRDDGDPDGDGNPNEAGEDDDEISSTQFRTEDAYLSFEIRASADASLHILLDLDDMWERDQGAVAQDDLLEECYFLWENIAGSRFSLAFGKKTVDYGMDDAIGISTSIQEGEVIWLSAMEQAGANHNAHAAAGTNDLPAAQPSDIFQVEAQYKWRDTARLTVALFQNNESTGGGAMTRGMHEDRSDDTLFFQSGAIKLDFTPKEGWALQLSAINWHNDSMGDGELRVGNGSLADAGDAVADKQALSIGFTCDLATLPLSFFGQYQHGWNWTYDRNVDADAFTLAGIWHAAQRIDVGLMAEAAWLDNAFGYDLECYSQIATNIAYSFENGITLILEYAHASYEGDLDGGGKAKRKADMVGFRTAWEF